MSITINVMVNPFGSHKNPIKAGEIHVASDGDEHRYRVQAKIGGSAHDIAGGTVPKRQPDGRRRSGHRNFLHLLKDILADIDLDEIGENYVDIRDEVAEQFPHVTPRDYR